MTTASIIVNGLHHPWPTPKSLPELLRDLKLPAVGVAIAVNQHIVPRARHESTTIQSGDCIEIVQPVGGG